jgi:AraC-like DNA-binding protein
VPLRFRIEQSPCANVLNFFEAIRTNPTFRKFQVGDLLFAQYTCPVREPTIGIWTHMDHLIHVLSGTKAWETTAGTWPIAPGETMFFKKGAYVLRQNFQADFCVLLFFIPDGFVRQVVRELSDEMPPRPDASGSGALATPVQHDAAVSAFLHSMAAYFAADEDPPEALLRLKLRELITGIVLGRRNESLAAYFRSLADSDAPSIPAIMEANFLHNLPLEVFARLCHRSLSSFKRDFQRCYGMPPGRWLVERRLERAAVLLKTTSKNVTQVAFECGFESSAHFSRAFKDKFGRPPRTFRNVSTVSV